MNQVKIGKFIAECRKEKELTQSQLAEKLNITDKAVSKWETGKGLPDASIMIRLCEELGINVNELLSGERLTTENYQEKASENIVSMIKVADKNKKIKNIMIMIIAIVLSILTICIIIRAVYLDMEVDVGYDEGIMSCEITENNIIYRINGLSVIHTKYEIVNTDTETIVFISNGMLLQNKIHSHWETWNSLAQVNQGKQPSYGSIICIDLDKDIPDHREKIKVYHTNIDFNKIKKATSNEIEEIINNSQLICESE